MRWWTARMRRLEEAERQLEQARLEVLQLQAQVRRVTAQNRHLASTCRTMSDALLSIRDSNGAGAYKSANDALSACSRLNALPPNAHDALPPQM